MKLGPKAARKKLVEALRSGEYTQTDKALRDKDGYCCLGVACDLYRKTEKPDEQWEPVHEQWEQWEPAEGRSVWAFMEATSALPEEVMNWLGFATAEGLFAEDCGISSLMLLNDEGKSFEYIADAIESGMVRLKEES